MPSSPLPRGYELLHQDDHLTKFCNKYWNRPTEFPTLSVSTEAVDPVPNDPRPTMNPNSRMTMDAPLKNEFQFIEADPFIPNVKGILVRDEYKAALEWIGSSHVRLTTFVIGHPGIGKTLFLYYVLQQRLSKAKPTIFQDGPNYALFFTDGVVYEIAKDARYSVEMFGDPSNEEAEMIWALVDDTAMVRHPVPFLMRSQRFRIIQSTTSRSERWIRYKNGAASFYYMEPFSWKEIMQGSLLQPSSLRPSRGELHSFYTKYGPSARNAYCQAGRLKEYSAGLHSTISKIHCDKLVTAIRYGQIAPDTADLFLVRPLSKHQRDRYHVSVVSETVAKLLVCERADFSVHYNCRVASLRVMRHGLFGGKDLRVPVTVVVGGSLATKKPVKAVVSTPCDGLLETDVMRPRKKEKTGPQ